MYDEDARGLLYGDLMQARRIFVCSTSSKTCESNALRVPPLIVERPLSESLIDWLGRELPLVER